MTKMDSRPIYRKNLPKSPSLELRGRWPWNLVYSIGYRSTTKFVQMMTLGRPWPFLWPGQICFIMLLHGWKLIQHIVMYFQGCSNSKCPMHSGEWYNTIWFSGLKEQLSFGKQCCTLCIYVSGFAKQLQFLAIYVWNFEDCKVLVIISLLCSSCACLA